ncbi:MAG: serine/threonine-protein kinase [Bryobacteraceae bacterium]|jgi:tetratricopeptide (TPR) repeat protein
MIAPADRRIGKYEIGRKLGRGGMADVYLAEDKETGNTVALKLIEHSPDADTTDAIAAERRGAELQAHLAAIDPRVVRVYGAGDVENYFHVAMEYIEGQDLAELLRRGPLVVEFAVDTAIAVAETLVNAHNLEASIDGKEFRGVVHGDIKPKNIRIDNKGEVRVLDFGIAKALSLSRRLTRNEFGSVPYASPERLDSGEVDVLSDLWSLAVMLYEMVAGLQPYHAESTERLESMIRSRIPPPPAPDPCPEPLRRILIKSTAPDAGARYQSAREFADDLIAFRQGKPVMAVAEDLEATRRTAWPEPDEATRRTAPRGEETRRKPPAQSWPAAASRLPKRPRTAFGSVMRGVALLAVVAILYGSWDAVADYLMYQHGQQLKRDIQAEQVTDPDQIWTRWTELSKHSPSSILLYSPRKAVKEKLVEAADRVIAAYRNADGQPVYEKDWERARSTLARALTVDPDDQVRGKLRVAEGHLARIGGAAHHDAKQLQAAVDDFSEAERLLPHSPDPELGLARAYFSLRGADKAAAALEEAERRGYQLANRDKMQLADGYRDRADRAFWDSRNVRGLPQEKDEVERAAGDYQRALDLYQSVAPYGNASIGIARVQTSLESVHARLDQIAVSGGATQQ